MEKTEEKITKETKDNEIVELKDENMSTISAGSGILKNEDNEIVKLKDKELPTISRDSENQNPLKSDSYVGYEIFFY